MKKCIFPLLALLLSGCSVYQPPSTITESKAKFVLADKDLSCRIAPKDARIDNGHARITLTNKGDKTISVQTRFYWYANKGLEVSPFYSDWHEITLSPQGTGTVRASLPNKKIVDFRVEIKK